VASKKANKPTLDEGELTRRLRAKYNENSGNGNAWAFVPQVRNKAGFSANRTIDAYVMALWPSRGLELIAIEIKSARSDWLRELKDGAKAEAFANLADRFYVVTGSTEIVKDGELPPTWGLMVPHGRGLRVAVEAPLLREKTGDFPPELDRSFLAALLRRATQQGELDPAELTAAVQAAEQQARSVFESRELSYRRDLIASKKKISDFEQAAGISLKASEFTGDWTPAQVGAAVRAILDGERQANKYQERLRRLRGSASELVTALDSELAALEDHPQT